MTDMELYVHLQAVPAQGAKIHISIGTDGTEISIDTGHLCSNG